MTTTEQVQFFEANGYLKFGKVLEREELEALREGLNRIIQLELEHSDDSSPEFKYGHDRKGDRPSESGRGARTIHQYVNMWKRDQNYERTLHNPLIAGTARALLRTPEVRLWHDQIISKPPRDNGHFRFHQDFYFWPLSHPSIVSCWLALDDATVENGCMHVIPGSHRDPRFSPEGRAAEIAVADFDKLNPAEKAKAEGRTPEKTEREKIAEQPASYGVPVELKAGECMFHHCLNFHATPQNKTDQERRAFVMIFMAQGVCYNPAQSGGHILVPTIEVKAGEPLVGKGFPVA
jgi:ectoine hydroxylase-related dioxygenase (phytanoyl-CoA dioxygenase family)